MNIEVKPEAIEALVKARMVGRYDFNPKDREAHDAEAVFYDGKKIKLTNEERKDYIAVSLKAGLREYKPLPKGSKVANLWMDKKEKIK